MNRNRKLRALVYAVAVLQSSCAAPAQRQGPPKIAAFAASEKEGSPASRPRESRETLPWVTDDWAQARAEAKRRNVPVFVDAWAPWCHSCQSLRAFVLTDARLSPLASEFVWLSLDTEKAVNASFVAQYESRVWPTLWVIAPKAEGDQVLLRWEGTATAEELRSLLESVKASHDSVTMAFIRASQEAANGNVDAAERGYREVLSAAQTAHPNRPRAVEALVGLLSSREQFAACTDVALTELSQIPEGTTSRAAVIAMGLSCARAAKRTHALAPLADAATSIVKSHDTRVLSDDVSALFEELVATAKERGDAAGARELARQWSAFLEAAASRAPTKQARAVFDPHRLNAYLALGEPGRGIAMLTESEGDFPDDYNPPARLARVYLELHRFGEAREAIARACAKVYGPRSLRVFVLAADIAKAENATPSERGFLDQALRATESLVLSPSQRKARDAVALRLKGLKPRE